jgi:putative Ca2+/H+ antiporter (TMEM165/GDT1 family)
VSNNKKTWAVLLGAAAGVTTVSLVAAWYIKTHSESQPIRDVQDAIGRAYDKIKEIEQIATLRYAQS